MRLRELYRGRSPDLSVELFPPKTPEGVEKLFGQVERLKAFQPAFFSMTYGAGGSTRDLTVELVDRLKRRAQVEAMCHLTVVGQSRDETLAVMRRLKELGIYNVIALRGDPPGGAGAFVPHPEGFRHSVELVRELRLDPFFSVAVAGFPEVHPDARDRVSDVAYLQQKVEAGAEVIITQLFFDNRYFEEFVAAVRGAGITIPVIPGILPILSVAQVRRFTALCKATIPPAVARRLAQCETDEASATAYGIELATEQCQGLLAAGVPGLHFYALNRAHSVEAVLRNLRWPGRGADGPETRMAGGSG